MLERTTYPELHRSFWSMQYRTNEIEKIVPASSLKSGREVADSHCARMETDDSVASDCWMTMKSQQTKYTFIQSMSF